MLRDEINPPQSLLNLYLACNLDQGIMAYLFAENKTAPTFFYLSFFEALATQLNFAKDNLKTALKRIDPSNTALLEQWERFFSQYHCDELAFLVYRAAIKAMDKEAKKFLQRTPSRVTKAQLQTAGRLAAKCGRTRHAEAYFARIGLDQEGSSDLGLAIDRDLLKLSEGKLSESAKRKLCEYVRINRNADIGFQALCSHTALGRMFNEPRWYTDTSLTSGSNRDMLNLLENLLAGKKMNLSHTTRAALVKQMQDDADFLPTISHRYPNIGNLLEGYLKQAKEGEFSPALFKPAHHTPNDKIMNHRNYEL